MITSLMEVYEAIRRAKPMKLSVAQAADAHVLEAVVHAHREVGVNAILVGNQSEIESVAADHELDISPFEIFHVENDSKTALAAVDLVSSGKADIIMKGILESADFLRAILDPERGIRKPDSVISALAVVELKKLNRIIFITDPGFTPLPDLDTKVKLIENAVAVARAFGIETPKIAVLSAAETVNKKMVSSTEAALLQKMNENGEITGCQIAGPISFDLALSEESVKQKKYKNSVGANADVLLVPSLEVGNVLYKSLMLFADIETGGIMTGAKAPIVFCSRSDSAETKKNAIALAVYMAQKEKEEKL